MTRRLSTALLVVLTVVACTLKETDAPKTIPAPPDVAAPPADALRTPSGLASKVLQIGLGRTHPTLRSRVTVHYTGWTTDGQMFDSSVLRNKTENFGLTQVIPGWTEKRRFWIPGALAYDNIPGSNGPKGMLVFDIELILIQN